MIIKDWKIGEDLYVEMTYSLLQTIRSIGFLHVSYTFVLERKKKMVIHACRTLEELKIWELTQFNNAWDASIEDMQSLVFSSGTP